MLCYDALFVICVELAALSVILSTILVWHLIRTKNIRRAFRFQKNTINGLYTDTKEMGDEIKELKGLLRKLGCTKIIVNKRPCYLRVDEPFKNTLVLKIYDLNKAPHSLASCKIITVTNYWQLDFFRYDKDHIDLAVRLFVELFKKTQGQQIYLSKVFYPEKIQPFIDGKHVEIIEHTTHKELIAKTLPIEQKKRSKAKQVK